MNKESVRIQNEMAADGKRSACELYSDLIIGRPDLWSLLKYELIVMFCSAMPGALGLWLRSRLYPCLLGKCGRHVHFGMNVVLRHPHKIEIEDNVLIDDNCLIDAKGRANHGIRIGAGTFIGRNSILSCKNGDIVLGRNVNMGFNSEVFSGSHVEIGDNTLIAAYCYFIGGDHDADAVEATVTEQGSTSHGITVGKGGWFGAAVKILDGVTIGENCIVGAGAVVNKDLPALSVSVGVPAKVIRNRRATA